MQKVETQRSQAPQQAALRQGGGATFESPQCDQIAQLEAMVEVSPQVAGLARYAAMANGSPQAAAQRRTMDMIGNSPRVMAQRKAAEATHNSPSIAAQRQQLDTLTGEIAQREETEDPLQPKVAQREEVPAKPNNTGLPDNLKSGIESLSGMSMDSVRVHYNSSQPAQLDALAYAQGTDIHVGPGQEQHLPHEAWHVVQQAQGRVKPTMQAKGTPINDDQGLEHEADVMGGKALGTAQLVKQENVGMLDLLPTGADGFSMEKQAIQNQHKSQLLQRVKRPDHGAGDTKKWYGEEIKATKTEGAIKVLVESALKEGNGVFLSDDEYDWEQFKNIGKKITNTLTLPDLEALKKDRSKITGPEADLIDQGDLTLEQFCRFTAEHELTHLKHESEHDKQNKTKLGANTEADSFHTLSSNFGDTVQDLKNQANGLYTGEGMHQPKRLVALKKSMIERMEYIENDNKSDGGNAEAPAVLREVRRYLETVLKPTDDETWHNFEKTIIRLDDECSKIIGDKIERGGCYLTTACTQYRGLADNCEELTILRNFRDGYMRSVKGGNELIYQYYEIAPKIVATIDKRSDKKQIYDDIYKIVSLCVQAIRVEKNFFALETYKSMVEYLSRNYGDNQQ